MQQVLNPVTASRRGRPPKYNGEPSEIDRERGRRVAVWIRSGMAPPHMPIDLSNADVARMAGISQSAIGYYLNDSYDANEGKMKLPTEDTIRKIAKALRLNETDGITARFWIPEATQEKPDCLLKTGQMVQIVSTGKRIRLTENLLRRLEIEADIEQSSKN